MGRRNHRQRSALEADQEKRGGKVLKSFRKVEQDDIALIGGALAELDRSKDIPPVKSPMGMQAFVFDPRLLDKRISQGLIAGIRIGQVFARMERSDVLSSDDGYDAEVGSARLLAGNRRTILLPVTSERLAREKAEFYRILGDQGIKGFTDMGTRSGHRIEVPEIAIGTFVEAVPRSQEPNILEAINTSLEIQLKRDNQPSVALGELETRTYDAPRH